MKTVFTKALTKDVRKIKDQRLITKIESVLESMKAASHPDELQSVKRMTGYPSAYRIRIGNYRLGFYYENDEIILARCLKRSDIYKVFP